MALFSLRIITSEPELTSLQLFELGAQGIEEREHPAGAELVLYAEAEAELLGLSAELDPAHIQGVRVVIERDGWETAWGDQLEPIELCRGYWVKPTTAHAHAPAGVRTIAIEPDLAFGIGNHPTTQLAAEALLVHARGAQRVLDVGTGTGVLSFLARLQGAERVLGLEIEPRALRSARKNAALNPRVSPVEFSATPLAELAEEPWDVVVANIETPVLLELAPALMRAAARSRALILTGVLSDQLGELLRAYEGLGARPLSIADRDDWRLVVLKPS
ncbi:MAG: 50S ribosomal protein L11 methyltransferase [Polyangiaceae bacterium]|nr:50S ribosomal protein L11 methyltransferase [Polyangiaceae bacterium]